MSTTFQAGILATVLLLGVADWGHAQEVLFRRRNTQAQDVTSQVIRAEFAAERMIRQQNQVIDATKHKLVRQQDRVLTVLGLSQGVPDKVKLTYPTSKTSVQPENEQPTALTQPVEGKTYFAHLEPGGLVVTDRHGVTPPEEELKIVSLTLQTMGKRNPLALFLDGKRIRVGQKIKLPAEVARELMGQTGTAGQADDLSLTLTSVANLDGQACGVFEASLRADNQQLGSTSLLMRGKLVIEIDSCRTRAMTLEGPVATSEVHGPREGRFIVNTNGHLKVAINSSYSSAR